MIARYEFQSYAAQVFVTLRDATARVLVFLLALAAALQSWGANQYASARRARATLAVLLACVTAAGVLLLPRAHGDVPSGDTSPPPAAGEIAWQPWSAQAVDDARAAHRVVFVDFTADWCITCKVNERQVLETERVRAALARLDVVTLKGDWTRRDDAIRAELARWGKGGVPLYLVYGPGLDDARVLPELLTPSLVVDALDAAALAR